MRSVPAISFFPIGLKAGLILFGILLSLFAFPQINRADIRKFSPTVSAGLTTKDPSRVSTFVIAVSDNNTFKTFASKLVGVSTIYEYTPANIFLIQCSWQDIMEKIFSRPEVLFIDEQRIPKEEVAVSNLDMSANKVNLVQSRFPAYNGQSLTVSIKENRPDTQDIDFKGRYTPTSLTSPDLSSHATIMATIIAGGGNTYYEGKGVAIASGITSVNFSTLLPEPNTYYQQYGISVQNHSYGTGIENFYGADATAYDASVITRPSLLHVFSAGNSGTLTSTTGNYAGIAGYANLTGSFKMAKDIITVGHTDSFGVVLPASSKGPAYDGRVKPELVAFAEDGSSGAAAIVSGIALTLQQAYKELNGVLPPSALVKAVLLNSADDVHAAGIDFVTGYGSANAYKAMQGITNAQYFQSSVVQGATNEHAFIIPANTKQVKLTLAWNDPPATTNAPKALINDLDVELFYPATNATWQPWVLNHFPHVDSLQQLPKRKRDSLNNVEQVSLLNPPAGNYVIRVKGFSIAAALPQSYAVAYQLDTLDKFHWYYPARLDNIVSGNTNVLRWESNFSNATGQLEYSSNNGNSWQLIDNAANLAKGYYKWNAPDTFTTALLRMSIPGQQFVSDTFTLSKRINTYVGFNCPDSFSFYWNKPRGVNSFRVYKLGDRYLEPLFNTTDTFVVLAKNSNPSLYYTIAPLLNNKTGVKSFAFNYSTQGVECYIRSFLATLSGNTGQLSLLLGTTYNINRIVLEKFDGSNYAAIQQLNPVNSPAISFTDLQLRQGLNIYRIRIELAGGGVIYSQNETLYYIPTGGFILYPNPVQQGQTLFILPADLSQTTRLQVINTMGQKVYETEVDNLPAPISTGKLSKGIYLFRFIKEDGNTSVFKVLVQ
ncbi:MAG TPA: S8 family serine peptidase [Chitinophagaceae bacterium]